MTEEKVWELLLRPVKNNRILRRDAGRADIDNGYEAAVLNLLGQAHPLDSLRLILNDSFDALSDAGEVCLVFGNKYSYQAMLGRNNVFFKTAYSLAAIKNILSNAGFKRQSVYPLLPRGRNMFEIIFGAGNEIVPSGLKSRLLRSRLAYSFLPAYAVVAGKKKAAGNSFIEALINSAGITKPYKCIMGHPNTLVIIAKDRIVRLPFDRLSGVRCRVNRMALKTLENTAFARYAPRCLSGGKFFAQEYFSEERLSGIAIDEPLPQLEALSRKAVRLIVGLHKETRRNVVISENVYRRLFGREFQRLKACLNEAYGLKLRQVEDRLKKQLLGKEFCTVLFHGDYKIENVLFDEKNWEISGVIDWDLSRKNSLPLLDVLYLLLYKDSLTNKKSIGRILRERVIKMNFTEFENSLIREYAAELGIAEELLRPLVRMFWVNHVSQRYRQQLLCPEAAEPAWLQDEVYAVLDVLSSEDK